MGSGHSLLPGLRRNSLKSEERSRSSTDPEEIGLDTFEILRSIGRGSFGKVCIVQKKNSKTLYALKYMSKRTCIQQEAVKNVLREIEILKLLEHEFLVNLWFSFQDDEDMFMVLDLMLGGDIRYHINEGHRFTEQQVQLYIAEIALVLDYLRSENIVHRDLKPDNLLLDDRGHIHLTDFNIATFINKSSLPVSMSGTKPYMAPEIFAAHLGSCEGYSFPIDWWSLGVTLCEMTRGKRPFSIHQESQASDVYKMFTSDLVLELPSTLSDKMVAVIKKLLQPDPAKRLSSVEELKKQKAMLDIDFNAVALKEVPTSFVPSQEHLNCDPTYELEEMIIEAKPLHKKKKKGAKKHLQVANGDTTVIHSSTNDPFHEELESCYRKFSVFNRERLKTVSTVCSKKVSYTPAKVTSAKAVRAKSI